MNDRYQYNFSAGDVAREALYDEEGRTQKARKLLAVLEHHLGSLAERSLLDISCSTGIMTRVYAKEFRSVLGIDIDEGAVEFANAQARPENLRFEVRDGLRTGLPDASFDVVSCTQMYEHVPDAQALMNEVHRVLKPGGVCYFGATNRLKLIETHYGRLPLLSVIPKPLAHVYLRVLGKARFYYETHYTLWGLKKLVSKFELIDYTRRIVADPERFFATEMVTPGSVSQRAALALIDFAYFLTPGYVWLLRKPMSPDPAST
ncbi:MAG TPA: class I SAM-dependent methyltransferase [Polyangiaceae bacterium]